MNRMLLTGNTFRKVLLNLSEKQLEKLFDYFDCRLIVTLESKIYPLTKDMDLRQYKRYIYDIVTE